MAVRNQRAATRYKLLSREGKLNARGHSIEMKDNLNVVANKEKDILLLIKRSFPPGGLIIRIILYPLDRIY